MTDIMERMTDERNDHERALPTIMTILAVAVPILVLVGGLGLSHWYTHRTADTSHIVYEYSRSTKFTKAQLDAAGRKTADVFSGFGGCTIERISYDETQADRLLDLEDESKAASPSYWSRIYDAYHRYGRNRIFIATVDFTCDGGDASLGSGEQSMTDYLYLNDDGRTWTEIDHGNG
ncbi:hypothetical protein DSM100688_1547 [Bifidobacterium ramosum]|uniref:Uncharacterized protein n=1 Tax=Bifidobacterium ramosum TaxID=1798158 RepID=A0A6L4WZ82_9BIFI|nr:hypothetical protein [Bifidobacterium ramosum]KAB8287460.1 hypothetical protein DSM100688_1547 [Bifidobacterium ramosum]NEG72180.1 hypothetical protein [Bifidobacterium ramosum]